MTTRCALILACALAAQGVGAQDAAQSEEPLADLPSLDDMLGIETEERPDDVDEDLPHRSALERALSDAEVSDVFLQAVTEMRDVADLLDAERAGAQAQRLQQDILLKLDQLIEQAKQQQQQQSSSSSSSSSSSQSPTKNQQRAQQQAQQRSQSQSSDSSDASPPGRRDGPLNDMLEGSSAAWGALPQRVREALMQGSSDRFSSLYESLTESYFRRLAEEGDQ